MPKEVILFLRTKKKENFEEKENEKEVIYRAFESKIIYEMDDKSSKKKKLQRKLNKFIFMFHPQYIYLIDFLSRYTFSQKNRINKI